MFVSTCKSNERVVGFNVWLSPVAFRDEVQWHSSFSGSLHETRLKIKF